MDVEAQTEENIRSFGLIPQDARLLAAVSGGVDSMVLLEVLSRLAPRHGWKIEVAHFNHQLRGPAGDRDEARVFEVARRLGLPFHTASGDVAAAAARRGISIEMAGRELRYEFFSRLAVRLGIAIVVLGHHADDQVETLWLRLLRGDAGAGLGGMRWKRSASAGQPRVFVRPFLNIPKSAIVSHARKQGIVFGEDATNLETRFERNRLRIEVIPCLEKFQPRLRQISLRAAELLRDEKEFLGQCAADWLGRRAPGFASLHPALQREVIRAQLHQMNLQPNFGLIEHLRSFPGAAVMVQPGTVIALDGDGVIRAQPRTAGAFLEGELHLLLDDPGSAVWSGVEIRWDFTDGRGPAEPGVEYFDAEAVGPGVVLRGWRPGDRFQPAGMDRPAKLQDLFTSQKIPAAERRERLLADAGPGGIFWVEGLRIGEAFKVRPETARVLKWSWRRTANSST